MIQLTIFLFAFCLAMVLGEVLVQFIRKRKNKLK